MQSAAGLEIITYSRRKCNKSSDGEQNEPLIDRLSALPDDIICHILFFLDTKESVSTSILARRWRFLWAYVPKLDFVLDSLRAGFSDVVNMVMSLHKVHSLEYFGLYEQLYRSVGSEYELESWITAAIDRNVKVVDLEIDPERSFKLPQCLFSCKTLVSMGLHCCGGIPLASSGAIHLPNLKELILEEINYEVEEALPHLLSGCPVLEELIVDGIGRLSGCLNFSSPTVKTLKLNYYTTAENSNSDYRVFINAPALRYLEIATWWRNYVLFSSVPTSLVEVVIQLSIYMFKAVEFFYYRRQVLKFLDSACNMKRLKLINQINEIIEFEVVDSKVRFNNLVILDLTADSQFLSKFIERVNKLGVLVIHKGYECLKTLMEPEEEECACLLNSFRTLTIHQFGCTEKELYAIEYILGNARVLERMDIYSRHDDSLGLKVDMVMKLSFFNRVSKECEVSFYF